MKNVSVGYHKGDPRKPVLRLKPNLKISKVRLSNPYSFTLSLSFSLSLSLSLTLTLSLSHSLTLSPSDP